MVEGSKKAGEIYAYLRDRINSGELNVGEQLPTDTELGSEFGVSRPTVAKALQKLQEQGLVNRRRGAGTYVTRRNTDRMRFGLLFPEVGSTEVFEPICSEIARYTQERSHSLIWGGSGGISGQLPQSITDDAMQACEQFVRQQVSGVFFAPVEPTDKHRTLNEQIVSTLRKHDVPIVLLDRDYRLLPDRGESDVVGLDNEHAGYLVTDHLLEQGCGQIVFVAREGRIDTVGSRISGVVNRLAEAGLPIDSHSIFRGDPADDQAITKILQNKPRAGVICANDATAAQLFQTFGRIGISVPDDVLVAGMDDVKIAGLLRPALTTLAQPCRALGQAAVHAMLQRIDSPQAPARRITLAGHLIARESTQRPDLTPASVTLPAEAI